MRAHASVARHCLSHCWRSCNRSATTKPFKSGVEIISITATVTDAEGHLVRDLPQEAFEVFEDGERQTITQFTNQRVPVGLAMLLDASDSMYGPRIRDARQAVDRFLFDLLDPSDEFFVFSFNHRPRPLTAWGRDRDIVQRALGTIQPSGGTAVYDAVLGGAAGDGDAQPPARRNTRRLRRRRHGE